MSVDIPSSLERCPYGKSLKAGIYCVTPFCTCSMASMFCFWCGIHTQFSRCGLTCFGSVAWRCSCPCSWRSVGWSVWWCLLTWLCVYLLSEWECIVDDYPNRLFETLLPKVVTFSRYYCPILYIDGCPQRLFTCRCAMSLTFVQCILIILQHILSILMYLFAGRPCFRRHTLLL